MADIGVFKRFRTRILVVVAINFVASIFHFGHNMAFFHEYPEPSWISSPLVVDGLWFVITPILAVGSWFVWRGQKRSGVALLTVYSVLSMLTLGHYLYASPFELRPMINISILSGGLAAVVLCLLCLITWHSWPSNNIHKHVA